VALYRSRNCSTEETDAQRRLLIKSLAALPLVLSACDDGRELKNQFAGQLLPSGVLDSLDGGRVDLGGLSGPCLINFWATWCKPCRLEMASLNRLFNDFRPQGLGVFAVSVDEDIHLVREFLLQLPLTFPILLDPGGKRALRDYRIIGYPTTFLVGRNALVKDVWFGERDWDASAVRLACEALCQL
jgi:thiol-disulfide isomerase/thioredoxin